MRDDAVSVIACGAAAVLGLPEYLTELRRHVDQPLRLLLTASAQRFLNPDGLRWHVDEIFTSSSTDLNPTEFAMRSRCVVVLPATAHMLASAALGLAGTPAQTALLSAPGPVVFLPSMNKVMWERATTRGHVTSLRTAGHVVIDPEPKDVLEMWSRTVAPGVGMPGPGEVAKAVVAALAEREWGI
jgi:phosphopantothenoylcysteine decarboxylase